MTGKQTSFLWVTERDLAAEFGELTGRAGRLRLQPAPKKEEVPPFEL